MSCRTPPGAGRPVRFRVEQVAVQGPYAVSEVTDALRALDADPAVDVIIVARGGGSLEDLLPFSDESLIRAVAACRTPVVSAIGHEQDVPLLDQVADVRASTPTDAARRVVPDVAEQLALIAQLRARARRQLAGRLDRELAWLTDIRSRPALADAGRRNRPAPASRYSRWPSGHGGACPPVWTGPATDIAHTRARLVALVPRGHAAPRLRDRPAPDASVVRAAAGIGDGELLTLRFADDQLAVTTGKPAAKPKPRAKSKAKVAR